MLYKYTSLDSLALILKSKKIRLNPITKMDDLQEAETSDKMEYGKYVFISSWMNQPLESIAMWKLYSDMLSGVRIGMQRYPFVKHTITKHEVQEFFPGSNVNGTQVDLILPLEECFNKNYFLINFLYEKSLEKVEYTDKADCLSPQILTIGKGEICLEFGKLGKYKNTYWEFQDEERYILRFLPINIWQMQDPNVNAADTVYKALTNSKDFLPYYDLEINDAAYHSMEITLSPQFSSGNRVLLESLCEKYNPEITIKESSLKDRVKL